MPEYIEREVLVNIAEQEGHVTIDDIIDVPAADVAPVRHGRWLDGKCTACGWEEPDICGYDGYEFETWVGTSFCPECGAKMDLDQEDDEE